MTTHEHPTVPAGATGIAAGVDVGTECVKAVVIGSDGRTLGRAVKPVRGYFETCAHETLAAALNDAQRTTDELMGIGATGFGMSGVLGATVSTTESTCHARGAFHHVHHAMTLVNIGGRDPRVITVDDTGHRIATHGMRRCAAGVGDFLMFAARHLDVNPAQLDELAAAAREAVPVSSYCSVFSSSDLLEQLRDGATREQVALGCMHSVARRVVELGDLRAPVMVSGGVAEYFPGVLRALEWLSGIRVTALPDAIFAGALGAALGVTGDMRGERQSAVAEEAMR